MDLGIGTGELIVIAAVALIVVGPKDLPMLMRKVGAFTNKLRGLAAEFRASFDEMARQAELDELRKEVEALRTGQMVPLGADADAAFRDIRNDLNKPLLAPADQPTLTGPGEWPESAPVMQPLEAPAAKPKAPRKKPASAASSSKKPAVRKASAPKASDAKPKVSRKKAVDL